MDEIEYYDYTQFKRHRPRIWRISDSLSLAKWGGLDLPAVAVSLAIGIFSVIPVAVLLAVFRLPTMVPSILILVVLSYTAYKMFTRENVKDTPKVIFQKFVMRRFQPKKYAQAIGADFAPDQMQWQVIFWRPDWAHVRIGDPRRWITYDPAPISEETREALDVTGAGELIGWPDHFYTDIEPDEDDEPVGDNASTLSR